MARIIPAFSQFFDGNGDPLVNGKLQFLESGTNNTDKATYADINETIPNTNPVILTAEGRAPNIFGTGSYKVISFTSDDVQIQVFDPVSDNIAVADFASWDSQTIYGIGDIVTSNDKYYRSIIAGNQSNDPETTPTAWEEIQFLAIYNANVTYSINDIVVDGGLQYRALQNNNIGNTPFSSSTFWAATLSSNVQDPVTFSGATTFDANSEFNNRVIYSKGADIASAAALTIGDGGNYFDVTGTQAITSILSAGVGSQIKLHFLDELTLAYDPVNLVLPSSKDIITQAGDEAEFVEYAAGDWRCVNYTRIASNSSFQLATGTSVDFNSIPAWATELKLSILQVSVSGTAETVLQLGSGGVPVAAGYDVYSSRFGSNSVTSGPRANGFTIIATTAPAIFSGVGLFKKVNGNVWCGSLSCGGSNTINFMTNGAIDLAATLDNFRVTTSNGTDTFDNGSFLLEWC